MFAARGNIDVLATSQTVTRHDVALPPDSGGSVSSVEAAPAEKRSERTKARSAPLPVARSKSGRSLNDRVRNKLQLQIPTTIAVEPNYEAEPQPFKANSRSAPVPMVSTPVAARSGNGAGPAPRPPLLQVKHLGAGKGARGQAGGKRAGLKAGGLNLPTLTTRQAQPVLPSPTRKSSSSPQLFSGYRRETAGVPGGAAAAGPPAGGGGGRPKCMPSTTFHDFGLLSSTVQGRQGSPPIGDGAAAAIAARAAAREGRFDGDALAQVHASRKSRNKKKKKTRQRSDRASSHEPSGSSSQPSPPTAELSLSGGSSSGSPPLGSSSRSRSPLPITASASSSSHPASPSRSPPSPSSDREPAPAETQQRVPAVATTTAPAPAPAAPAAPDNDALWDAESVAMRSSGLVSPLVESERLSPSAGSGSGSGSIVISSTQSSALRRQRSFSTKTALMLGAVGIASPSSKMMSSEPRMLSEMGGGASFSSLSSLDATSAAGSGPCGGPTECARCGEGKAAGSAVCSGESTADGKPRELRAAEHISPTELVSLMRQLQAEGEEFRLLLIDMRSFFIHERNHIVDSVNISLPRALTSKNITLDRVEVLITSEAGKSSFRDRAMRTVVIYDEHTRDDGERPADSLVRLLVEEGEVGNVFLLADGFANFESLHPDMCAKQQATWLETSSDEESPALSPYVVRMVAPTAAAAFAGSTNLTSSMVAAAAGAGAGGVLGGGGGRDSCYPSEVIDGLLYLGSERNASNLRSLTLLNVECILNMASECKNHFPMHFEYKSIDIFDDPDVVIDGYLDDAAGFIHAAVSAGRATFVHCYMGISRSATVTLVYLMKHRGMTLQAAYDLLKAKRPKVCPNSGFMAALIRYERKLFGSVSLDADEYAPFLAMDATVPSTPRAADVDSPKAAFAFPEVAFDDGDDSSFSPSFDADADAELERAAKFEDAAHAHMDKRRGGRKARRRLPSKSTTISAGTPGGAASRKPLPLAVPSPALAPAPAEVTAPAPEPRRPAVPLKKSSSRPSLVVAAPSYVPPPVTPRGGSAGAFAFE
ncbi:dual specificity phosphatase, variant [Thecamonas trahens ATCC 50062]|nr:dual specificity phosphatase, variant [Thecamonas trahens ATCC 50062]KNC53284.1 dual specificity phosphatase, variant [Thecamonas trahens ATCC 50062]|eukprot:XP_013754548.1 dual specificity phosphatase, variant [Thecamonas trahens ATCC 50062]